MHICTQHTHACTDACTAQPRGVYLCCPFAPEWGSNRQSPGALTRSGRRRAGGCRRGRGRRRWRRAQGGRGWHGWRPGCRWQLRDVARRRPSGHGKAPGLQSVPRSLGLLFAFVGTGGRHSAKTSLPALDYCAPPSHPPAPPRPAPPRPRPPVGGGVGGELG